MREPNLLTDFTEGVLCALTKRVMIISPFPDRVRALVLPLSSQCFDMFTLHEFSEDMLPALSPELIVYDALPVGAERPSSWEKGQGVHLSAKRHGIPLLVLVDDAALESAEASRESALEGAELQVWPADPQAALDRIHRMLEEGGGGASQPSMHLKEGSAEQGGVQPTERSTEQTGLQPSEPEGVRNFKDIRLDTRRMIVEAAGERIDLTKTEYDLLLYFIDSEGVVVTREMLLDHVWGHQFFGGSNVVDVHVKSLRKKLKDSAVAPKYIATVRGAGYRLADG
ncbi:winged helix-turn-helix domain-containing protein [Paenibacillus sp. HB172176]|uniref:winged helix-turn-helix domain-containing protein n=1 Tax=Paenibacillus sp. HB172176 TaxID=2493690 RepID=UPI0014395722|nr:winged helix-turn-helix domain-containing protein [Paenibacillus sp. HB172176]